MNYDQNIISNVIIFMSLMLLSFSDASHFDYSENSRISISPCFFKRLWF